MIQRRVTILGSTGSVGCSTLDLMEQTEALGTAAYQVEALTGGANVALLAQQARRWKARIAVTAYEDRLDELRALLAGTGIETAAGDAALTEAALRPDRAGQGGRRGSDPGRFRAFRHLSGVRRHASPRRPAAGPDRFGRAVSHAVHGRYGRRHA